MIEMFNINNYVIDTSNFDHALHSSHVKNFEEKVCEFVGAKYACGVSSATNAIFLSLLNKSQSVKIPTIIPPVVINAVVNGGNKVEFIDDPFWVGDSYVLHQFDDYKIVDSAQKLEKNQFKKECNDNDLMIFSFYPTKPVGSLDGGMVVSNDLSKIEWFREATLNGMSYDKNNWERRVKFPGWKMYLSSIQAYVGLKNLEKLDEKNKRLKEVQESYNKAFNYTNSSMHLYRISVKDREVFLKSMKENNIRCGIHYKCSHLMDAYKDIRGPRSLDMPLSRKNSKNTVSIPFNETLTSTDVKTIIDTAKKTGLILSE